MGRNLQCEKLSQIFGQKIVFKENLAGPLPAIYSCAWYTPLKLFLRTDWEVFFANSENFFFIGLQAIHAIVSINLIRRAFRESILREPFMPDRNHVTTISDFLLSVWLVTSCHQVIFVAFHGCLVTAELWVVKVQSHGTFIILIFVFFSFHIEMVR